MLFIMEAISPATSTYEPVSSKRYKLACAPIKDSDQSAGASAQSDQSLDVYSIGSQGLNVSSGQKLRLWSDWANVQTALIVQTCELLPLRVYQLMLIIILAFSGIIWA